MKTEEKVQRARYHQLWCEYRVHLVNTYVFGAAAQRQTIGTDVSVTKERTHKGKDIEIEASSEAFAMASLT